MWRFDGGVTPKHLLEFLLDTTVLREEPIFNQNAGRLQNQGETHMKLDLAQKLDKVDSVLDVALRAKPRVVAVVVRVDKGIKAVAQQEPESQSLAKLSSISGKVLELLQ
jgi:hypothetical protein